MKKGFTLVELLVVISVISFLSSIIFSVLGSARSKAGDSAVKQTMHSIQNEGVLLEDKYYYLPNYSGFCTEATIVKLLNPSTMICYAGTGWAVYAVLKNPLPGTNGWCVDNVGNTKATPVISGPNCDMTSP